MYELSVKPLVQGIAGAVVALPGQAVRAYHTFPAETRKELLQKVGLGDTMSDYFYYGNPQLYKMPLAWRTPSPPLAPTTTSLEPGISPALSGVQEDSLTKALPFIALGILGIVGYNMFFKKKKRRRNPATCRKKGPKMRAAYRHSLPDSDFADPANEGLPIDTKGSIRAAMSRFGQYRYGKAPKRDRKRWFNRIVKAAHKCGMDTEGFESKWRSRL